MIGVNFDVTEQKRGEALLKDFSAQLEQQVARRTAELLERKDRLRAVLGALTAHVAVLDRDGWIVAVNPAWEAFARDNGGAPERCCVGVNYLDVCRRVPKGDADAELARQVEAGLRDVLAGRIPEFTIEYPFCSSREIRWFLLQAAGLRREHGGAVVSHLNITSRVKAERVVRDKENRLRAILENAFSAIVTIDSRGIIEEFNKAAERMFGYSADEVLGHNVKMLLPSPYRQQHDGYLRRYLETGEAHLLGTVREVQALRKDGSLIDVALSVSQVDHLGLFTGIFFDISRRKELEREVVEIASSEQRRIGSDLHDSVGQELTALNLLAGDLAEALHTDPSHAGPMIDRMVQGLNRCQRELRAVMRGLLPVEVDTEGLMAALSDLAERTRKDGIETCTFDCPVPVAVPDNLTATHLYLIAQEAVRNAIKHARPRNIRISLESNGLLVLSVQDDGVGMPVQTTESPGGLGLRIMRNRAAIIGATLTIQSAEPTGTLVRCVL